VAILDDSPKMSAALSRRIVSDLLKEYCKYTEKDLIRQVDKFVKDRRYPRKVRENLHTIREIANFGAHTQQDLETGEIVEVTKDEAVWCLDMVDVLFDCLIIGPLRDEQMRNTWYANIARTGRKPIKPLPPDEELE
jgi:hypothetical protein